MRQLPTILLASLVALLLGPAAPEDRAAGVQAITVAYDDVISTIEHPFLGVNYVAFWDDLQGSETSRQALRNAGVQIIRFPGGEPANWHDWARPDAPPYWTTTSTDELWRYAQGAGARLLLQTNPTRNAVSDTGEVNDPSGQHAAAWVTYARARGIGAPYWEVGNEPDMRLGEDPSLMVPYLAAFAEQAAAMKAADPAITVLGPAGTNAYQWWQLGSLEQFLVRHGNRQGSGLVDGISLHYYPTQGCLEREQAWEQVRSAAHGWPQAMEHVQAMIRAYDTRRLPVFITESNAAVGALDCPFNVNATMAAALANADLIGVYRESGVQAVQLFGNIHGVAGWALLHGAGEVRPAETPTPTYFILPIWSRAGSQVLRVSGLEDPQHSLSAYASRTPEGSVQVVIINKTSSPRPLTIRLAGASLAGRQMDIYELRPAQGSVLDTEAIYNGVAMPDVSSGALPPPAGDIVGETVSHTAPGYSLTLLTFSDERS